MALIWLETPKQEDIFKLGNRHDRSHCRSSRRPNKKRVGRSDQGRYDPKHRQHPSSLQSREDLIEGPGRGSHMTVMLRTLQNSHQSPKVTTKYRDHTHWKEGAFRYHIFLYRAVWYIPSKLKHFPMQRNEGQTWGKQKVTCSGRKETWKILKGPY